MAQPSVSSKDKSVLIVAVDFGTTYSGVCFTRSDCANDAMLHHLVKEWPSKTGPPTISDKVPTRIAYPGAGTAPVWGFQIAETDRRYQEFKLLLDKTRKAHHSTLAQRCKEPTSLPLVAPLTSTKLAIDFLTEMRKCLEKSVNVCLGTDAFQTMQVQYVITVPAIWSDEAKDLTLFCAKKADMSSATLITEPEAAMVHVLQDMSADQFTTDDTFMMCDAGGGTVDLITYKVTSVEPLRVEEVVQGNGDRCGSAYITRLFHTYVKKHHATLPGWTEDNTAALVEGFESKAKRTFEDKDEYVIIKVPGAIDCQKRGMKIQKQKVFIPAADIKVMFDEVCPIVFTLIKEQRRRAKGKGIDVTGVILVGGFCESPYLRKYLAHNLTSFGQNFKIIVPQNGWSAVVRGALSRALPILNTSQNFARVTSRFARRYYGITDSHVFDPSIDHESKKFFVESNGQYYVERIQWFLGKGKPVKDNYEHRKSYAHSWKSNSVDPRDTTIYLKIVSWDSEDEKASPPMYPDAPGVKKLTDLNVDLSIIPESALEQRERDDIEYSECYPDVSITYQFATIQYRLYIEEKCYGEVYAGFEA